ARPGPARALAPPLGPDSSGNFVVVWAGNPGVARKFFTTDPPCPQSASRLEVDLVNGGADLLLTWTDAVNTQDHIVFEDSLPNGPFTTQTGGTVTGAVGLTTPVPPGTTFFRVAGRNTACGVGPLN
ncbi:MAG: hypothetical protein ACE5HU_06450, partial [Acidobacteriota bacterium]